MLKGKIDLHSDFGSAKKKKPDKTKAEILDTNPTVFPASKLLETMKPKTQPKDPYEQFTPQPILDEITQWFAETMAKIQEHRDNPGFRKALTDWLDESGL